MANIQKRVNKQGQVSYRIKVFNGYSFDGKQIVKTMTWKPEIGMTERQAEKEVQRQAFIFEEKCKNNLIPEKSVKFKDLAEEWLNLISVTKEQKIGSIERLKSCKERTYKAIGNITVDKLSYRQIQQFILSLAQKGVNQKTGEGLSEKTQKHYICFISDVMKYAIKCGLIINNPCKNISVVKTEKKEKEVYSLEELKEILNRINKKAPSDYKIFFMLIAYCGLRRGEALGLEYKDFDFEKGTVSIVRTSNYRNKSTGIYTSTPKTKTSFRTLVLPQEVLQLIPILKAEQTAQKNKCGDLWNKTDRLFITWCGQPMHPNTPYTWFERFCEEESLPFKGLHSFRHSFATQAITGGVDISTVSSILGHSQTSTTLNIYTHAVQTANVRAMNVVADLINGKEKSA